MKEIRSLLTLLLFPIGLLAVLHAASFQIAHVVYGDFVAPGAVVNIAVAGVVMLGAAHLLARGAQLPIRLIFFYVVAFGGLRLAVLPLTHREFGGWTPLDYFLLVSGVGLCSAAFLWAYSLRRARLAREAAAKRRRQDVASLAEKVEQAALHVVRTDKPSRSHLGGEPGLPGEIAWPARNGARLRFLARLSLTDLQARMATPWLPQSGALLFFYDDDEQPWGFDPKDRGGWAVLHVPDIPARLPERRPASSEPMSVAPVAFLRIKVLPSCERPEVEALKLSDKEADLYSELAEERFRGLPKHQLLGLPEPVQGDGMELECQLASNGVYCGSPEGYQSQRAGELQEGAGNWRLLFQMDSDDDLDVMWGDAGMLYFWIEEAAARKGDFSNVWLVLQCS